ncbi:hypothetical protein [Duganella callida]|uniref:Uncharacterized protein n=1 Tax=Duganella callida TaxID=2561932 RepID=A0A4Y9S914_9BURK|nr:hypothetical protein [Duganella callida]TFW16587.1 hypothetical protein E4L98_22970 [Duganella callida]
MKLCLQDDYDGPTMSTTINRDGNKIHRLADDTAYPSRVRKKVIVRRDPMVEALFGAAPPVSAPEPRKPKRPRR